MDIVFNELSIKNVNSEQLNEFFNNLITTFKSLKEYNFKRIIFPSDLYSLKTSDNKSLGEWISNLKSSNFKSLLISLIGKPYYEDLSDKDDLTNYYYTNEEVGLNEEVCLGLGLCNLKNYLSISFNSHNHWCEKSLQFFKVIDEELQTENVYCNNIVFESDIADSEIQDFIDSTSITSIKLCTIEPNEKRIKLRDDHGKDILETFSKKILKNKYSVSVVNSLEFSPYHKKFIKNISENGIIEIVLHWDDRGIGIALQTTAENIHQTKEIASILQREYDK